MKMVRMPLCRLYIGRMIREGQVTHVIYDRERDIDKDGEWVALYDVIQDVLFMMNRQEARRALLPFESLKQERDALSILWDHLPDGDGRRKSANPRQLARRFAPPPLTSDKPYPAGAGWSAIKTQRKLRLSRYKWW